jgi:hypothetical protein
VTVAQQQHRETPKLYGLGGRACKNVASENTLYNTTIVIHKGYYSKEISERILYNTTIAIHKGYYPKEISETPCITQLVLSTRDIIPKKC